MTPPFCVCVPARNEAARLPRLFEALAAQDVDGLIPIALCINNSDDGSAELVRVIAARPGSRLQLHLDEASFPPALAHAGSARRRAMDLGAAVSPAGLLLSTDADCRPPPSWIGANLAASAGGANMIGGRIVIDPEEPLAPLVQNARHLWDAYWERVRAIEDAIDPRPWDPAPRHGDHTGASLALPTSLYRAAGGVPLLALGEDRALVDAAITVGGRLAHPASVWTYVSPRQDGRAAGGMADDMRRLHGEAGMGDALVAPAFTHWQARAEWRRALRGHPQGERRIVQEEAALPPMPHDMRLADAA
ncbi:glycosyltransferase family 2 protein [Sphingomonas sp. BIUV-7]|uniref:Glycosyltransferase family 2 protein n=1 Tax=Sphingomonas natans TaxID=3063330 RepID=A0ABT8Y9U3_9SPHN|nr:glycosyltransferase family 2 protein [Sphingomonas sp. BIUV-7]MDO6415103.1 glycosyltransferase family 2 protein [Sphingomonas sp. BIUV-7]